jgi:hypothetical protein
MNFYNPRSKSSFYTTMGWTLEYSKPDYSIVVYIWSPTEMRATRRGVVERRHTTLCGLRPVHQTRRPDRNIFGLDSEYADMSGSISSSTNHVNFDAESMKFMFSIMQAEMKSVDNPLKIKIPGFQFCLWIKHVRKTENDAYYLNVQTAKKFDASVQDEKLGLELTAEGCVASVMVDGKHVPAETYSSILYDPDSSWNVRLTGIARKLLEDRGFLVEGTALVISQLAIDKVPELLIRKWSKLAALSPVCVRYLDSALRPLSHNNSSSSAEQDEELFHLFSALLFSLFDGKSGRPVKLGYHGCPLAGDDFSDDYAKSLGKLISHIFEAGNPIKSPLPDQFFRLLAVAVRSPKAVEERVLMSADALRDPDLKPIAAWIAGDAPEPEALRKIISDDGDGDGAAFDGTTEIRRARALKHLQDTTAPYLRFASAVCKGLTKSLSDRIRVEPVDVLFASLRHRRPISSDIVAAMLCCTRASDRILTALAGFPGGVIKLRCALGFRATCKAWERAVAASVAPIEIPASDAITAQFLARFSRIAYGGDVDGSWLPALREALARRRSLVVSVLRWSGEVGSLAVGLEDLRACDRALCAECVALHPGAGCECGGSFERLEVG